MARPISRSTDIWPPRAKGTRIPRTCWTTSSRDLLLQKSGKHGPGGEAQMLTLYFAPGASSMAPHIALNEIGVAFEKRPISFKAKDNRTLSYLAINPEGTVPTLVIDGRPLTEVAAILFYLARRYPEAGLLPADDVEAQAQAISWMSFIAA